MKKDNLIYSQSVYSEVKELTLTIDQASECIKHTEKQLKSVIRGNSLTRSEQIAYLGMKLVMYEVHIRKLKN